MSGRASWVLGSDGLAHLPVLEGPGMLVSGCRRSLPDAIPHTGVVPQGQRRCPECFAALLPCDLVPQIPAGRRPDPSAPAVPGGQPVPDHPGPVRVDPRDEDTVLTDPAPEGCPYCESTRGVSGSACESPRVETWRCVACGGQWWTSTVNPMPPYLARLTQEIAGRSLLREVRRLAEHAPGLSDGQVRARLLSLLAALDQHARTWPE